MAGIITVTALILAGGRGSRVNYCNKGLLPYQGKPLVQHVIERIQPQLETIIISANSNREDYSAYGYPVIADEPDATGDIPFDGPLAGILAGMQHCQTDYLLVLPCDVPHITKDLLAQLQVHAGEIDVIIAKDQQQEHYLVSLWHMRTANIIQSCLQQGQRAVKQVLQQLNYKTVQMEAMSLKNVNCARDFK